MAWKGLRIPQPILDAIEEQGFQEPTPIQKAVLPKAIKKKCDVVGAAETGSGKTLAFGVPLLARVIEAKKHSVADNPVVNEEDNDAMSVDETEVNVKPSDEECDLTPDEEEAEFYWEDDQVKTDLSLLIEEILPDGSAPDSSILTNEEEPKKPSSLKGLVICPTRELALQVGQHLRMLAKNVDISIAVIFGGMAVQKQERVLKTEPDIVVGTPGRLWHFIEQNEPHLSGVPFISALVIDEADRLVEKGHFEELQSILNFMNSHSTSSNATDGEEKKTKEPPRRQTLVFSATLTFQPPTPSRLVLTKMKKKKHRKVDPRLKEITKILGVSPDALFVDLTTSKVSTLKEYKVLCPEVDEKDVYLVTYLRAHRNTKILIFCNSKEGVRRLRQVLSLLNFHPSVLFSTMHQKQRLKNSEKFRSGTQNILLASDVAARGWDVPEVEHVIHYDIPATSELFVHRSGRTARANHDGVSVLLLFPKEMKQLKRILFNLKRNECEIPVLPMKVKDVDACRKVVRFAKQIVQESMRVEKKRGDWSWLAKTAQEADLVLESDVEEEMAEFNSKKNAVEKHLKHLKEQLSSALKSWNS